MTAAGLGCGADRVPPAGVRPWPGVLFPIRHSMGKSLRALLISSVIKRRWQSCLSQYTHGSLLGSDRDSKGAFVTF